MSTEQNSQIAPLNISLGPEMLSALIAYHCRNDETFRDRFEDSPKEYLEEMSGMKLPEKLKITVTENSDKVWNIPLPSAESLEPCQDLSDEDLGEISGGVVGAATAAIFTALIPVIFAAPVAAGVVLVGGGILTAAVIGGLAASGEDI